MNQPQNNLEKLRQQLYQIIKTGGDLSDPTRLKGKIQQQLCVDDEALKNMDGNVVIIQNASINSQVINHGTEALKILDDLEKQYLESPGLEAALIECYRNRISYKELLSVIRDIYYRLALKFNKTASDASMAIGVKRTTLLEHTGRKRRKENREPDERL